MNSCWSGPSASTKNFLDIGIFKFAPNDNVIKKGNVKLCSLQLGSLFTKTGGILDRVRPAQGPLTGAFVYYQRVKNEQIIFI